jgi:DNA invertase Pin-like site-specific DNA recombinase
MTVNITKLRQKMIDANISIEELAYKMSINKATLYRKINSNGKKLKIGEIHKIVEILSISKKEAIEIFLQNKSQ